MFVDEAIRLKDEKGESNPIITLLMDYGPHAPQSASDNP